MSEIIKVENLTRKFNGFVAVDNVSFGIESGEIFGLLGPNGAGKTTIVSMLSTMLKPTSGTAVVNGFDIIHDQGKVRESIGIVFQDPSLDEELTAYENMDLHARLYRIPKRIKRKKIIELLDLVELKERKDDLVKTFSGGMKRRLEIARSLLHEPKVLFLDEPTIGLDPQTRNRVWQYIHKLNQEKGITVILTTHYIEEADKVCNRVAIIDKGKIIAIDAPKNLKDTIGEDIITIKSPDSDKIESKIKSLQWIKNVQSDNNSIIITLQNAEGHIAEIVNILNSYGYPIISLSIHKPTLEDVFLYFTGKTIREEEASTKDRMRMRVKMRRKR